MKPGHKPQALDPQTRYKEQLERHALFIAYVKAEAEAFASMVAVRENADANYPKLSAMFTAFAARVKQMSKAVSMEDM